MKMENSTCFLCMLLCGVALSEASVSDSCTFQSPNTSSLDHSIFIGCFNHSCVYPSSNDSVPLDVADCVYFCDENDNSTGGQLHNGCECYCACSSSCVADPEEICYESCQDEHDKGNTSCGGLHSVGVYQVPCESQDVTATPTVAIGTDIGWAALLIMITSVIGVAFIMGIILLIQERRKKIGEFNFPVIETSRTESVLLEFDINEPLDDENVDTIEEEDCSEKRYILDAQPNQSGTVATRSRDAAEESLVVNTVSEMENLCAGESRTSPKAGDEPLKEHVPIEKTGYGTRALTREPKETHNYNNTQASEPSHVSNKLTSTRALRKGADTGSKHYYHYPKVAFGEANQPHGSAPTDDDGYLVPHEHLEGFGKGTVTQQQRPKPSASRKFTKTSAKESSPYEVIELAMATHSKKPHSLRSRGSPAQQERVHTYQNSVVEKLNKNGEDYDTVGV